MEDDTVECEGAEESPVHCSTANGELRQDSGELIDFYSDIPSLLPSSSELFVCPAVTEEAVNELPVCPVTTIEVCVEQSVHHELSVRPVMTTEVIPLSAMLPVLGVAIWYVWAAYTIPETLDSQVQPTQSPSPTSSSVSSVILCPAATASCQSLRSSFDSNPQIKGSAAC